MNNNLLDILDFFNINIESSSNFLNYFQETTELYNLMPTVIMAKNNIKKKFTYNIIGVLDTTQNIFYWAWALNLGSRYIIKTKQLIIYGINQEPKTLSEYYIKKILTSSFIRIYKDSIPLSLILAIAITYTKSNFMINKRYNNYIIYYGIYEINELLK